MSDAQSNDQHVARIVRAAIAFVDAVDSDEQIDAVAKQAPNEWVELADAVIMGRREAVTALRESP